MHWRLLNVLLDSRSLNSATSIQTDSPETFRPNLGLCARAILISICMESTSRLLVHNQTNEKCCPAGWHKYAEQIFFSVSILLEYNQLPIIKQTLIENVYKNEKKFQKFTQISTAFP